MKLNNYVVKAFLNRYPGDGESRIIATTMTKWGAFAVKCRQALFYPEREIFIRKI